MNMTWLNQIIDFFVKIYPYGIDIRSILLVCVLMEISKFVLDNFEINNKVLKVLLDKTILSLIFSLIICLVLIMPKFQIWFYLQLSVITFITARALYEFLKSSKLLQSLTDWIKNKFSKK